MRKLILAALVVGAATVAVVALASPPVAPPVAPASPPAGKAASRRLQPHGTPEMLRHSRLQDILYFVDIVYTLGVLILLLRSRLSAKLRDLAERAAKSKFLAGMLYVILLVLALPVLGLPLTLCARH